MVCLNLSSRPFIEGTGVLVIECKGIALIIWSPMGWSVGARELDRRLGVYVLKKGSLHGEPFVFTFLLPNG